MSYRPVVMVVEDDLEMNELERELLSIHGMETVPAYTGAEALALCNRSGIDAILLDVMLPEMDGLEACRRLRRQSGKTIPIVILTTLDSEDCRQMGYAAGADAYFTKPFDPDEVITALRQLMDGRGHSNGA